MNALLIGAARMARRTAPACAATAAALLTIGVYPGDARVLGHPTARHGFSLTVAHRAITLRPGSSLRLTVKIHRRHLAGAVKLRLTSKPPPGLTARFAPAKTRRGRSVLTLRATTRLRPGSYALKLRGAGGRMKRTLKLAVTILQGAPNRSGTSSNGSAAAPNPAPGNGSGTADVGPSVLITGNAGQALEPGSSQPIDLQIENPNSGSLTITSLAVAVAGVDAPRATASLPCTASDFSVQQYSGLLPLVIAPNTMVSLQQLGVPESDWPEVSMIDRASNQDGCQGASLALSYHAASSLG